MQAEQLTAVVADHAEGPVWHAGWGGLKWVDMLAGDVLSLQPNGSVSRWASGSPIVACVRPRARGGMVLGIECGFALVDDEGEITELDPLWSRGDIRMNEGACDPQGNFWCGSMAYDQAKGAASLWRLTPGGEITEELDNLTVSNGLCWDIDGRRAFYNDTDTYTVSVFDFDAGQLVNRRVFADLRNDMVRPDGLTIDAEGGVWVALSNGGAVRRYDDRGRLSEVISLPVQKVTACTFGSDSLNQMFITTSREGVPDGEQPQAGALFIAEPGVAGVPVLEFGG